MKVFKGTVFVFLAGMLMVSGMAFAADVTTAIDVNSAYVWRGITFNDGVVIQPSVNVAAGNGFNLNVWGNLDVDDYDDALDSGEFSEVDLTMSYTHQAGPVALTAGYIEYLFPTTEAGGVEGTREVYLDISGAPAEGFSLGLTSYYDFDEVDDFYLNPYLGYGMELMPKLSMSLRAGAGWAGEDFAGAYGGEDSGFFDYTLSAGLTYAVTDNVSVSGRIAYTDSIDDDVLPEPPQDVNFYGGVGVSVAF
ncbi:MAG: MltA-interacting MipA family protein [Desulfobacteraceae bacterium]|nr:MAG: MltA-interacting MipA family protein [Desulfobacteraceae bacterium]